MIFIVLLAIYLLYAYRQEKSAEAQVSGYAPRAYERAQAYDELHRRPIQPQVDGDAGAQSAERWD